MHTNFLREIIGKVWTYIYQKVESWKQAKWPPLSFAWASLVAQWSRIFLSMQETQVQFLGQEDLLGKEVATHSSFLAWEPMDRGAWQVTIHEVAKVEHNLVNKSPHHIYIYTYILTHRFILSISFYYRASLIKIVSVLYSWVVLEHNTC